MAHTRDPRTPLIGRTADLAQLADLVGLDDPTAAGAVLLAGDAGVGKTRLLTELRDLAQGRGWRVLVGHCFAFGDSALPYLPFTEILGRLATEAPALTEAVAEAHPSVRRLLPGRRLLSGAERDPAESMDRADLFDAVHAVLEQLAAASPVLVLVEDAHWADQSTREMLGFLFSRGFAGTVSLVTSYRGDDLHRRHPLRSAAAEWARMPAVRRIQLSALSDGDVRRLVRALHPSPLAESAVHAIVERAEGNAFFTEELVDATAVDGPALPDDLADLLLVRLDKLGESARQAVRAASIAGRRVTHELLSRVVDLDADELDRALRSAVEQNVLVPAGDDGYAFRHALLAEAVYDDLLPGERSRLHAAYATVLRTREVEGTAAELARHARAAHDLPTAIRASIEAGDDAMAVGGPDDAAGHYELALELLSQAPPFEDEASRPDVVVLTAKASDAVTAAGNPHRAQAIVRQRLRQLPHDARDVDRARLLVALATAAVLADTNVDALEASTEALALVPAEWKRLRAKVLGVHAQALADRGRDEEANRVALEAIALGEELDMPRLVADATTTLARLDERAGDPVEARRAFENVVAQARADGEVMTELRGLHHLGSLLYESGDLDEAMKVYSEAAARAVEGGRPWAPYGLDVRVMAAITAYVSGDWDTACEITDVAGEAPPTLAEAALVAVRLGVAAGRGQVADLALLPQVRTVWDRDGVTAIWSGGAAIDLLGDDGDLAGALEMHDAVVDAVTALWQVEFFQARVRLSGLTLGQLGNAVARTGSGDHEEFVRRGRQLVHAAEEAVSRMAARKRPFGPEGHAWVARTDAEFSRLRWLSGVDAPGEAELVAAWERAVAAFEAFPNAFELARSRTRLAAVLRAVGRTEEARAAADLAREAAHRLGAEPLLRELRELPPPGRRSGPVRDQALTARESEILALVAQGRSNAEIARQLFISAKTVSVHVSNILAKLGARGRTEAAAVARRRGLLAG